VKRKSAVASNAGALLFWEISILMHGDVARVVLDRGAFEKTGFVSIQNFTGLMNRNSRNSWA